MSRSDKKGDKLSPKVTERAHPLPCGELPPQRLRGLQIGEARKKCNGDDRRQRRIQGGAVGAAVSRTRVPLKARSGRWAPQPVLAKRLAFFRFDFCFGVTRGEQPLVCNGDDRRQRRIQGGAVGAAATTAASGGYREELLGQRPAGCECRPRHEADAGCRNPSGPARRNRWHFSGSLLVPKENNPRRAAAHRHRCDLAALNTRHLLRKPVCGLKAPLGLSCPPGTAVLSGSLLVPKENTFVL